METHSKNKSKNIIKLLAILFSGIGLVALFVAGIFLIRNDFVKEEDSTSVVLADTSGTCGDNLTWTLDSNGVLTISGAGDMTSSPWTKSAVKEVVIENGVTNIMDSAFANCSNLTSVTIPGSVTSIGEEAFWRCYHLTSINIPNGVTSIGRSAFYACWKLTSVTLPNSLISIGRGAFNECKRLKSIEIPSGVISTGEFAFDGCQELESVVLNEGLETIGSCAFRYCSNLRSIIFPQSLIDIWSDAFYGCSLIASINIPKNVANIGNNAFYGCENLMVLTVDDDNITFNDGDGSNVILTTDGDLVAIGKDADIPNTVETIKGFSGRTYLTEILIPYGVTSIGDYAFDGCVNLTSITIPSSVTSIGVDAFFGCSSLTTINIPYGVSSIGMDAFKNCSSLTSITVDSNNEYFSSQDGILYDKNKTMVICCPVNRIGSSTLTLPNSVTTIKSWAFYGCYNLISLNLPNGLVTIEEGAFEECVNLININIPSTVTSIGSSAFNGCVRLKTVSMLSNNLTVIEDYTFRDCNCLRSINIPEGVITIGSYAFWNCYSLTSISIPSTLTSIGTNAFENCNSFSSIVVESNNPVYSVYNAGSMIVMIETESENVVLTGNDYPTSGSCGDNLTWTLSDQGVLTISGTGDMTGFTWGSSMGINRVVIENGVTSICPYAFYGFASLTSITIPNSVTSIGSYAFYGCKLLTPIIIPNSVTSIGEYAFFECSSLRTINIPYGVTSIGDSTFWGCSSLISLDIPSSVTSIGNYAFLECDNLTSSIYISENMTNIALEGAFRGGKFTSITVDPNNLYYSSEDGVLYNKDKTKILYYPAGKAELTFSIPNTVTSVENQAFAGCNNLRSVIIPNSVTRIHYSAFAGCSNARIVFESTVVPEIGTNAIYDVFDGVNRILVPQSALNAYKTASGWTLYADIIEGYSSGTEFNILWRNWDGTSLQEDLLTIGDVPVYTSALPTRAATAEYNYEWDGWTTPVKIVTENAVYTADYLRNGVPYTITYDSNDGTTRTLTQNVVYAGSFTTYNYDAFERNGYTIVGWSTDPTVQEGIYPCVDTYYGFEDTDDITLYAIWGLVDYEIAFDLDGGTANNPETYTIESAEITLNNPTRNGAEFAGWTGSNGDTPEMSITIPTGSYGDKSYTANWTLINYTITTTVDGVESEQNYNVESDDITLVNPTKDYYDFTGWTGSNGSTPQTTVTIPTGSYGNKEYTANWTAIEYTISYTLNGGTATNPATYTVESDDITLNNPTKLGYNFLGWTGSNGSTPQTTVTIPTGSHGNLAYTANFEEIDYYLTYNLNGGNGEISDLTTYHIGDIVVLTNTEPTKDGYEFNGWKLDDKIVTQVTFETSDITVVADWRVISYTIKTIVDGVEGTQNYTVESESITLSNPTKLGYTFLGWTGGGFEEPTLEVVIPQGSTGNRVYTANWSDPIEYTITYTLNGGTAENPATYTVESENITLTNPTKPGYTFIGWTGTDLTEATMEVIIPHGSIGDRAYTANWSDPIEYTITYTLNGGTAENPATYTVESANITLSNPTKAGYTFTGWTGTDLDEATMEVVVPTGSIGNRAYTANWSDAILYTITYTLNGGTAENPGVYIVESENITLANPTKLGYTFLGWTGTDLEEETMEVVIPQGSTGNRAYTANFEVVVYTITTTVDGVESTQNYTVESENITLENPTKIGYIFKGWTGTDLEEETMEVVIPQGSTGDREYTANFEEVKKANITLIIALAVSGVVLVGLIVLIVVLVKRRKKKSM